MIRKATLFAAGALLGGAALVTVSATALIPQAAVAQNSDTYRQLNLFGDVFERILADYVDEVDEAALIEAAIDGMISFLDPHSTYLDPPSFEDMQVETSGEFGGLGIEVTMEDGLVKVIAPIDETPASRAGVLANDLIVRIDGKDVLGLTIDEAVSQMRGQPGTDVTITIQRGGVAEPFDVTLTRDIIRFRSVRAEAKGEVAYIRINQFTASTFNDMRAAIPRLIAEIGPDAIDGIILDLRNNPGGLLDSSIDVADAFLDRGEILSTRGRNPRDTQVFNSRPGDLTGGLPLIVLINGGSASASEIVAGALQDQRRATLVGTRSFGKGSVQTIMSLGPGEGAVRLTTARYYTPSGNSIQAVGIVPDIEILQELPEELLAQIGEATTGEATLEGHLQGEAEDVSISAAHSYVPFNPDEDTQLQYALRLLRGEEENAAFPPDPERGVPTAEQ